MYKIFKYVGYVASVTITLFLAVIIIFNLYIFIARTIGGVDNPSFFGWSSAVVVSVSMSGSIEVGDLIIIKSLENYKIGDIITYKNGDNTVTHRIIGKNDKGFVTKGDANNTPDEKTVSPDLIIGKVVLRIAGFGAVIAFLKTPFGMLLLLILGLLIIECSFFISKMCKRRSSGGDGDENAKN